MRKLFILIGLLSFFSHIAKAEANDSTLIQQSVDFGTSFKILSVQPFQQIVQLEGGCFKGDQMLLLLSAKDLQSLHQQALIDVAVQCRLAGRSLTAMQFLLQNERISMNVLDHAFISQFCQHEGRTTVHVDGYVVESQNEGEVTQDYFILQAKPSQSALTDVVED